MGPDKEASRKLLEILEFRSRVLPLVGQRRQVNYGFCETLIDCLGEEKASSVFT